VFRNYIYNALQFFNFCQNLAILIVPNLEIKSRKLLQIQNTSRNTSILTVTPCLLFVTYKVLLAVITANVFANNDVYMPVMTNTGNYFVTCKERLPVQHFHFFVLVFRWNFCLTKCWQKLSTTFSPGHELFPSLKKFSVLYCTV